jgi:hypothetical protein
MPYVSLNFCLDYVYVMHITRLQYIECDVHNEILRLRI